MQARTHRRLALGLAGAMTWSGAALLLDATGHTPPPAEAVDAVVVAGCSVEAGGRASPCLAARSQRAIELYRDGRAPTLIFTGGVGTHGPSEAEVGAALARAAGVPSTQVRIEPQSSSTWENARFASALGNHDTIIVVTDSWHTHRTARVFRHHFSVVHPVGVQSPMRQRVYGAHREVLALVYYALRGRL